MQKQPPSFVNATRYGRVVDIPPGTNLGERFPVFDIDFPVVDPNGSDLDWTVYVQPDPAFTSNDDWDAAFLESFIGTAQAPAQLEVDFGTGATVIRDRFVQVSRLGICEHYVANTIRGYLTRVRETLATVRYHVAIQRGRPVRTIQSVLTNPSVLVGEPLAQIPPFARRIDLAAFQQNFEFVDFNGIPLTPTGLNAGIPPLAARVNNTSLTNAVVPFEVYK